MTWDIYRWLPKEERSIEYYVNEYRFVAGDSVNVYTYTYTADVLFSLEKQADAVTLANAISGITFAAASLFATATMLAF